MKNRLGKKNPCYRHGRYTYQHYCLDCNKKITSDAIRCRSCAEKIKNLGKNNGNYKPIGSWRISGGYKYIKIKNNYWKQEHIYKVEKYLDRKRESYENIHHIDGNKLNNKLNNLYIFKNSGLHLAFELLIKFNIINRFILKSNLRKWRAK